VIGRNLRSIIVMAYLIYKSVVMLIGTIIGYAIGLPIGIYLLNRFYLKKKR